MDVLHHIHPMSNQDNSKPEQHSSYVEQRKDACMAQEIKVHRPGRDDLRLGVSDLILADPY